MAMYCFFVGEELNVWKVCDIPAAAASSLEMGTESLIQVPHQVAFSGLKSSILEHVNEPVWASKDLPRSHAGPVGPVGPVFLSSSPPIMRATAPTEDDIIIKTTTPIMAAWDIYSNLTFFLSTYSKR